MGQKLHHNRRTVFKKRNPLLNTLAWIAVAVLIVAGGFFGAKFISEHPSRPEDVSAVESGQGNESTPTKQPEIVPAGTATMTDGIRAFYLPFAALRGDALETALQAAGAAGFNGIIMDMKDADGALYYQSSTEQAALVNSTVADALSVSELKQVFTAIRNAGLQPIPRLFAFKDNAAARALTDARISPEGNSSWVWYDGKPNAGGKAWLNPYADAAHLYIIQLARELRDAGATAILLDGVQFPAQTSSASFGNSANTSLSKGEVLTKFIDEAQQLLGDSCPVILACSQDAAAGEETQIYGANPMTFHEAAVAPAFLPVTETDTLQKQITDTVHQFVTRIKVIPANEQPLLIPQLPTADWSADDLRAAVAACRAGGASSYILYNPSGQYDFAALCN